jgi:Tol biopolymer transport system component
MVDRQHTFRLVRSALLAGVVLTLLALAAPVPAHPRNSGRIGFQSDRGPATRPFTQLYSMKADGSGIRALLPAFDNSFDIAWSPNGRRFAFTTILDVGYFELHIARAAGTRVRRLTFTGDVHDAGPAWSARGNTLAFVTDRDGNFEIYLLAIKRPWLLSNVTRNAGNDCGCYDPFNTFSAPSFSPDGKRIAFTSDVAAPETNLDVYVINIDGPGLRRLTTDPGVDAEPDWSPDGRRIAFNSTRDGDHELYVMDAGGRNVRQLTHNHATDRQPDWSPDGRALAYTSDVGGADDIWIMRIDGTRARNLTNDEPFDERPAWQPRRRSRHDDD